MPPSRIFIVRHGERADHKDPAFSKTYPRPHDPPLTADGVTMATTLGSYLSSHYKVDPRSVLVLTSPLQRCVQTSDGIVRGLLAEAHHENASSSCSIPIFLEPCIMEGAKWMFHDMLNNTSVANAETREFHCPQPVYHDAAYHQAHTSSLVQLEKPFLLHAPPEFVSVDGHLEEKGDFYARCQAAVKKVLTQPELEEKTVILVGHGETVLVSLDALVGPESEGVPKRVNPSYTSFVTLTCEVDAADAGVVKAKVENPVFSTPHLPQSPTEN